MSEYKVTIKVIETYTYDVEDARCTEDAVAQTFRDRHYWSYECDHDEYAITAEPQEPTEDYPY